MQPHWRTRILGWLTGTLKAGYKICAFSWLTPSPSCLLFSSSSSSLAAGVKGCLSTSAVAFYQQHSKARRRREDARRIRRGSPLAAHRPFRRHLTLKAPWLRPFTAGPDHDSTSGRGDCIYLTPHAQKHSTQRVRPLFAKIYSLPYGLTSLQGPGTVLSCSQRASLGFNRLAYDTTSQARGRNSIINSRLSTPALETGNNLDLATTRRRHYRVMQVHPASSQTLPVPPTCDTR